jgi:hypothetical protein
MTSCNTDISPLFQKGVALTVVPCNLSRNLTNYTNTCSFETESVNKKHHHSKSYSGSSSSSSSSSSSGSCCSSSSSSSSSSILPQSVPPPNCNNTLTNSSFFTVPDLLTIPTSEIKGAVYTPDGYYVGHYYSTDTPILVALILTSSNPIFFNSTNLNLNGVSGDYIPMIYRITSNFNIIKDLITGLFSLIFLPITDPVSNSDVAASYMAAAVETTSNFSQNGDLLYYIVSFLGTSTVGSERLQDFCLLNIYEGKAPSFQILSGANIGADICIKCALPQLSQYKSEFKLKINKTKDPCSNCYTTSTELKGEDYDCGTLTFKKVNDCNSPPNNPSSLTFKIKTSIKDNHTKVKLTFKSASSVNPLFQEFFRHCTTSTLYFKNDPISESTVGINSSNETEALFSLGKLEPNKWHSLNVETLTTVNITQTFGRYQPQSGYGSDSS